MTLPVTMYAPFALSREKLIFLGVFLYGLVFQFVTRGAGDIADVSMWADQIQFVLERDPRMFDLLRAYGHPNTLQVELGVALHVVFGISYSNATMFSMSILIAGATAGCAAVCASLFRSSPWWATTSFILLLDRPYFGVTPPTAIAIPFTVLMVLAAWWAWDRHRPWQPALVGIVIGMTASTRLNDAVLIGSAMMAALWYRFGTRWIARSTVTAILVFVLTDPFLWFLPLRHLSDLVRKFTVHYAGSGIPPVTIELPDLIRALAFSMTSLGWAFVLLTRKHLSRIVPVPIVIGLFCVSVVSLAVVLTSPLQSLRYLAPLLVVWEILLPLLVLETVTPAAGPIAAANGHKVIRSHTLFLICLLIFLHILTSLLFRPHLVSKFFPATLLP